jgi:hypothetical protein
MQPTVACTSCGAEIPVEARFCRSCGQPSARFNRESVTEETTRHLETPERPQTPPPAQDYFNEQRPGGLAQPTNRLPPETNPTSHALEPKRKPTNWVVISVIVLMALALITLGLVKGLRKRPAAATPPTPQVGRPGPVPVQPAIPPPPVPQPPTTGNTGGGAISDELIYPGAQTVQRITSRRSEGNVLQLQTSDSFDKVVNWYKEKLNPEQTIEQAGSVILPTDDVTAIITSSGGTTNIMLTDAEH